MQQPITVLIPLSSQTHSRTHLSRQLSNAIKFTNENGSILVQAEVFLTDVTEDDWSDLSESSTTQIQRHGICHISVSDSGAGMSKEQVERLFRDGAQFNVNALQNGRGSGLGLFIAKELVERHGGSISAKSEGLGKGATFQFELPLYNYKRAKPGDESSMIQRRESRATSVKIGPEPVAATALPPSVLVESSSPNPSWLPPVGGEEPSKARSSSPVTSLSSSDSRLRVLIVEDVASNRKLLRRLLERQGHVCQEAENGDVAFRAWNEKPDDFDVILMDYEMPVKNGPTAARELRQAGCTLCIVGVTGNMLPEDVDHFMSCGATGVLAKPLKMPALEKILKEHGVLSDSST